MAVVTLLVQSLPAMSQISPRNSDRALEDLRQMGKNVKDAVVAKDIPTLLMYDRADWRSGDEDALRDHKSELYCYLFDSACISWRKQSSVYEKISRARELTLKVIDGGKSPANGLRYAFLVFFDRSVVSEKALRSSEFLCGKGADHMAVWSFKMVSNKWEPARPFFDFATDSPCPPQ